MPTLDQRPLKVERIVKRRKGTGPGLKPSADKAHPAGKPDHRPRAADMAKEEFATVLKINPDNHKARKILGSIVAK